VFYDSAALHHELHSLKFGDIGERIARYGDHIGEFTFVDRSDSVLPTEHLCIHHRPRLKDSHRRHTCALYQPLKIEALYSVGIWIAVNAAADEYLHAFSCTGHGDGFLENGNN